MVGVGALIDRGGGTADLGVPKAALLTLSIQNYNPAECPLCKSGIPAVKPGSRSKPVGSKQKAEPQGLPLVDCRLSIEKAVWRIAGCQSAIGNRKSTMITYGGKRPFHPRQSPRQRP